MNAQNNCWHRDWGGVEAQSPALARISGHFWSRSRASASACSPTLPEQALYRLGVETVNLIANIVFDFDDAEFPECRFDLLAA